MLSQFEDPPMHGYKRVLVVMDKWKGTLTAGRAAQIIADSWASMASGPLEIRCLPMSDGGEGFGEALGLAMGGIQRQTPAVDALGRPISCEWWQVENQSHGIFETSRSNGLAQLPRGQFHPGQCDTFGVGQVLRAMAGAGMRTMTLGIGGSATNDGGFGMARALGYHFSDDVGQPIFRWTDLVSLRHIQPPEESPLAGARITVACDVTNPLLGEMGATRIYGPQKGLTDSEDVQHAERCLTRLADVVAQDMHRDFRNAAGAGAAGGLGYGLAAFADALFTSGFDLFAERVDLSRHIAQSDLVVTGEGRADASTLMGKGVGQVLEMAQRHHKPVVLVCGEATQDVASDPRVHHCWPVTRFFPLEQSLSHPEECLRRAIHNFFSLASN